MKTTTSKGQDPVVRFTRESETEPIGYFDFPTIVQAVNFAVEMDQRGGCGRIWIELNDGAVLEIR